MNTLFRLLIMSGFLLTALLVCQEEFHQLKPPTEPIRAESICQGPPIQQNIIGVCRQ